MIGINQLRFGSAQPRVAQPHSLGKKILLPLMGFWFISTLEGLGVAYSSDYHSSIRAMGTICHILCGRWRPLFVPLELGQCAGAAAYGQLGKNCGAGILL